MPVIKAGARKLHMHCNQRSFVETEFGSFFKLFAEIKFCVFNCLGLFWNLFESEFSKIIFFFLANEAGFDFHITWFEYSNYKPFCSVAGVSTSFYFAFLCPN